MANSTISFKLSEDKLVYFKAYYEPYKVENNSPYVTDAYKKESCSILLYSSLSVVFQGPSSLEEAKLWGYNENKWDIIKDHAGSDEVGTGDIFGPVVVVASFVKEKDYDELIKLGINDSKKLTDKFILENTKPLIEKYPHSILILDNEKYNEQIEKGLNMNSIKALMHNQALLHVTHKVGKVNNYVIDQFCEPSKYFEYCSEKEEVITNIFFTTKGESHSPAVALSSMIARYTFLIKVKEMEEKYGISIPLGASSKVAEFANTLDPKLLRKIAKFNFKSIKK